MTRRKRQTRQDDVFEVITGFAQAVDAVVERLTGKPIAALIEEFRQRPRELPGGEIPVVEQPTIPLADAYAVLGLPQTASMEEVERNYRSLAKVFHPDKGGYAEAMVLLNQAYNRIKKERNR